MKFSMGQQLSQANLLEALISCFESILENGNLINTAPDTDDASLPSVLSDFHDSKYSPKTGQKSILAQLSKCILYELAKVKHHSVNEI